MRVPLTNGGYLSWYYWKHLKVLPRAGGLDDQELSWLALMQAIELVFETINLYRSKGVDFSKITANQWQIIEWLDL